MALVFASMMKLCLNTHNKRMTRKKVWVFSTVVTESTVVSSKTTPNVDLASLLLLRAILIEECSSITSLMVTVL